MKTLGDILFRNAVKDLMVNEPFWSTISYYVRKIKTRRVPTMGVTFINGNFLLFYNDEFVESMYEKDKENYKKAIQAILKHEYMHIVFDHTGLFFEKDDSKNKKMNVAMDLAINSFLIEDFSNTKSSYFLESACFPGHGRFKDLPSHKSWTWYYENMSEEQAKFGQNFDIHMTREELNDLLDKLGISLEEAQGSGIEDTDSYRDMIRIKIAREAADKATSQSWGSVTQDMKAEIIALLHGKIDWRAHLRNFVSAVASPDYYTSFRKINRRYPWISPGTIRERVAKIAVSIDMSGSMSDQMLSDVATELNGLSDYVEFTVIPFDTEVDPTLVYKWKKGTKRMSIERVKSGGTILDPPIQYVDNSKELFSGHIMFSDLYADIPGRSRTRMLMVIPEGGANQFDYPARKVFL